VTAPITGALSGFIAGSVTATIPEEIRELARRHVLDTVASIVACRDLRPAVVARRFALANSGSVPGGAAILGTAETASLVDAVFASAMAGHGAEINDFMPGVLVQPGPAVVGAALVFGARLGRSGDDIVRAVVAGYELAARVPRALGSRNLYRAGVASHGIGPLFGAAAAASVIARLPAERIGDVLSCCAQQASGSLQWMLDVEHIEKSLVFAGMGARDGIQSVLLVEAGYRGVPDALDRDGGWLSSPLFQGGDADRRALTQGLDRPAALHDTAYKRHPVGGPAQPAVEALLAIADTVDRDDVGHVLIEMPGRAAVFRDAGMPALNVRYLAALILIDGHLDFTAAQSLERMHGDRRVIDRMARVDVVHDPAQEAPPGSPRTESARVTATLRSGGTVERFVPSVQGFPSHPMGRAEVEEKAHAFLGPRLGAARTDEVVRCCLGLDALGRAEDLVGIIGP
jgi:2-methylcitrate dehydratase PrpD